MQTARTATQPLIALTTLMQLESMAREAQTLKELQFQIVNETRRLFAYRQAYLFAAGKTEKSAYRVEAASSVPVIEREAPLIRWLEHAVELLQPRLSAEGPTRLTEKDCPKELKRGWKEYSFPHVLWCPLRAAHRRTVGGWWLTKDNPWEDNELVMVRRLADTYAHAWYAFAASRRFTLRGRIPKAALWVGIGAAIIALFLPVRLSTLAPAKIIAKEPAIVSAPIDGVIAEILVPPNTPVSANQTLFRFEDTNLRNQFEVAEKNLAVALAQYRTAAQGAFLEAESKARVPLLKAEAELRRTERDYAQELMSQVEVRAPSAGLLVYTDKSDWVGRPVVVGERIMEIADPRNVEIRIDLPVRDAIILREGAPVKLFLDASPLDSVAATLTHASYHAEVSARDTLAYRVTAQLAEAAPHIRIGWQGTAKIYGDKVSLFFFLFRRPISTLRQFFGL